MLLDRPQKLQVKVRPEPVNRIHGFMYALQRPQRTGPASDASTVYSTCTCGPRRAHGTTEVTAYTLLKLSAPAESYMLNLWDASPPQSA